MTMTLPVDLARGMTVEVEYTEERPSNDPSVGWETVERTDTGIITAVPSRTFDRPDDDFDFDYELQTVTGSGATRSVDLDAEQVCQLHYDAGGDRDWATYTLDAVTVTGVSER